MSGKRRIEYISLGKLRPDPRNPKAHSESAIGASVGRFGFVEPIVVDERTGFIASGHGRVETLRAMHDRGDWAPDGVKVDGKKWLVPVVAGWRSENDTEAGAALIALNRTTELGGWVDEALLELLDEIDDDVELIAAAGFTEGDRKALQKALDRLGQDSRAEVVAEEVDVDAMELEHRCPSCGFEFND